MDNQNQVPTTNTQNTNAVIALVTGIVAVVFSFCGLWFNIIGLVCAIVAIVFAIKGRKVNTKKGMATAGLVTGIIGAVLCPIFLGCNICVFCAANKIKDASGDIQDYLNDAQQQIEDYDWNLEYND